MSNGCKMRPFVTEKQWALNYLKILDGLYVSIELNISLLHFSEMKLKFTHGWQNGNACERNADMSLLARRMARS